HFLAERFDAAQATPAFQEIASDGEQRHALMTAFVSACRLPAAPGCRTRRPLPCRSGKYLKSVLDTAFAESGAFEIELSEIVTRSANRPSTDAKVRYRSICLGHERGLDARPERLLTASAGAPPDETLVEAGAFVFVARRL